MRYIRGVPWKPGQKGGPGGKSSGTPPKPISSKLLKSMFRERLPEVLDMIFGIVGDEEATNRDRLTAGKLALEYGEGRPAVIGDQPSTVPPDLVALPPAERAVALRERGNELLAAAEAETEGMH